MEVERRRNERADSLGKSSPASWRVTEKGTAVPAAWLGGQSKTRLASSERSKKRQSW